MAGKESDRLLRALDELGAELEAKGETPRGAPEPGSLAKGAFREMLSEEDEGLVTAISAALARIVAALSTAHPEVPRPPQAVIDGVLGGAELVMRAEIAAGRRERLPRLAPGFTYLTALPFAGQEEALRLSQRTGELLGKAGG